MDDDATVNQNHLFQATHKILSSVTSANEESIVRNCLQNWEDEDIPPNSGNVAFCLCNFMFNCVAYIVLDEYEFSSENYLGRTMIS